MTEIVDSALFDGLKAFQSGNGLEADGVMRPGGPTAKRLSDALGITPADPPPAAPEKPAAPSARLRTDGMRDFLYRPKVDGPPRPAPAVLRPGMVWDNGRWRPETPQERAAPKIVPMAQKAEAPAPAQPIGKGRDSYHKGSAYIIPSPSNDKPINPEQAYKALEFDLDGPTQTIEALRWASANEMLNASAIKGVLNASSFEQAGLALVPIAERAKELSDVAKKFTAEVEGPEFKPPEGGVPGNNDARDAFRHALWNFLMTREIGEEAAKGFGDAHEVSVLNREGVQIMDLYNNHVGRKLALDPDNKDRDPVAVVREALQQGRLRTRPFNVRLEKSQ